MSLLQKESVNRTGFLFNPLDGRKLRDFAEEQPADPNAPPTSIAAMRAACAAEADPIGSIPVDGTADMAAAGTSSDVVATPVSPRFLDRLGERLAFERSGVRLYEALISKVESYGEGDGKMKARLEHFRAEEAEHFALLCDCIVKLGADPTAQTPAADVCGVTSMGFVQMMCDPRTDVSPALTALLAVEATDQCGWELLIAMAQAEGLVEMVDAFSDALKQENEHLTSVKQWLTDIATGGA
jgi:rubrerythrin